MLRFISGSLLPCGLALACASGPPCGPEIAEVERVVDGDTLVLQGGERVRYLLVDTPELGDEPECFGIEAARFNRDLVENRTVRLSYDAECRDGYGRLLAHVAVGELDVAAALVERGYACVLHIPPNGADRVDWLREIEAEAKSDRRGLWGACWRAPCAR